MRTATDLRATILEKAGRSFRERGVKATTIKTIVHEAGCTNAALYYYFEGGKDEVLEQVLRSLLSEKMQAFERLDTNQSFAGIVRQIATMAASDFERMTTNLSWLIVEFDDLPREMKSLIHEHLRQGHSILARALSVHIPHEEAERLAWMLFCTLFGYHQVFMKLGLSTGVEFPADQLVDTVVRTVADGSDVPVRPGIREG